MLINNKIKKRVILLIKISVTLLFIAIINRTITAEELEAIPTYFSFAYFVPLLLLTFVGLWFHVMRWQIILRYMELNSSLPLAWKSILWGTLLAFVTPGRVGELFRGVGTVDGDKKDAMFAVVLDKIFILSTVFIFGIIATIINFFLFNIQLPTTMFNISIAIVILSVLIFILLYRGHLISEKSKLSIYFNKVVTGAHRVFAPSGIKAVLYSFLAHAILIIQTVLLLRMFGCGGGLKTLLAVVQAYAIMPFFAISIAELGIREGAVSYFINRASESCSGELTLTSATLAMSILIVVVNLMIPATVGLILMIFSNKKNRGE